MPPDRTICRQPSCFRTFKGNRGLGVHLGIVKKCGKWYQDLRCKGSPSDAELSRSDEESVASVNTSSTASTHSFKFPWSSAPKHVPGELHNPSGIRLPWSSQRKKHRPDPRPLTPVPELVAEELHVNAAPASPEDNTFLCFVDEDAGKDDPRASDASPTSNCIDSFPGAAKVFEDGVWFLDQIKNDRAMVEKECGLFYPFKSLEDFTLAAWLSNSGASMSSIDKFLRLPFVSLVLIFHHLFDNSHRRLKN